MVNKNSFLNPILQDIEMVKGDTLCFCFELEGAEDPTILFTCREKPDGDMLFQSDEIVLEASESGVDTYSVSVAPELTSDLETGTYYYDLKMNMGEDVITLMRGRLSLLWTAY